MFAARHVLSMIVMPLASAPIRRANDARSASEEPISPSPV